MKEKTENNIDSAIFILEKALERMNEIKSGRLDIEWSSTSEEITSYEDRSDDDEYEHNLLFHMGVSGSILIVDKKHLNT